MRRRLRAPLAIAATLGSYFARKAASCRAGVGVSRFKRCGSGVRQRCDAGFILLAMQMRE